MNLPLIGFTDCETTGLDPFRHQVHEVALIVPELAEYEAEDGGTTTEPEWREYHWWLNVDLAQADPESLRIGGYHERHPLGHANYDALSANKIKEITEPEVFAAKFARLTNGLHLGGIVPSFDELFLRGLLLGNNQCPMWHYQVIDVETLVVGYLKGLSATYEVSPPWDSEAVSLALGVDPAKFERHTALGDARLAKALYEAVSGQ